MADYLLGLDIGTTSTKGILLHPEAGITATAEAEATLTSPQAGWAEADPGQWWANVATVSRACLAQAGAGPDEVAGIGVSGMLPTVILLDKAGRALYPSIQQNDARAVHPVVEYFGTSEDWIWSQLNHPCINQLPHSLDLTGANSGCVTPDDVYDLMGNLHEWIADPDGTFKGGFYVDTYRNGNGCLYTTTAHNTAHYDYSTGFRCCADR